MTRSPALAVMGVALFFAFNSTHAQGDGALNDQRQAAQEERQLQKAERGQAITDATRAFRDFARALRSEYRERINELETKFERRRVELRAEHDAEVAEAEAGHKKRLAELLARPNMQYDEAAITSLEAEAKTFSDELFELRRALAESLYRERVAKEERKNTVLSEQDALALERASSLGLMQDYAPILATPIGEGLTPKEERWNERERKEVARLEERIAQLVSEFATGEALRKWEIENLKEDFELAWQERTELHAVDSEQAFYDALLAQGARGASYDQKKLTKRLAELTKQKTLIEIRYKEIRDRNRIERREEKKALLAY